RPAAGPLAKFTRGASEPPAGEAARQGLAKEHSEDEPAKEKKAEPGNEGHEEQRPPRGKGKRPPRPPRSDGHRAKQQAENADVDRGLDVEEQARRGAGPKSKVPV